MIRTLKLKKEIWVQKDNKKFYVEEKKRSVFKTKEEAEEARLFKAVEEIILIEDKEQ
jgi:hypothetical protein